jgi:hypothetical protein
MNIAYKLADLVHKTSREPFSFTDIGPECFAGTSEITGTIYVCWKGETFVKQRLTLRVRLHNWLIRIGSPRTPGDS